MASQKQIAAAVGVSVCTVSKILAGGKGAERYSPERRAAVEEAARRLGYQRNYNATALRSQQTPAVGLLFLTEDGAESSQTGELAEALDSRLRAAGRHSLLLQGRDALTDALRFAAERRVGGLLVYGPHLQKTQRTALAALAMPVVLINAPWADDLPLLCVDGAAAMQMAVDYVAERGRRCIRYLGWRDPLQASSIERAQAVKEAAEAKQINVDEWTAQPDADGNSIDAAYAAVRSAALIDQQADAIICYDDAHALGAMYACRDSGLRIHRDVDIIGFGNSWSALTRPALSSISAMHAEIATRAVDDLLRYQSDGQLYKQARGHELRLKPELIIRNQQ